MPRKLIRINGGNFVIPLSATVGPRLVCNLTANSNAAAASTASQPQLGSATSSGASQSHSAPDNSLLQEVHDVEDDDAEGDDDDNGADDDNDNSRQNIAMDHGAVAMLIEEISQVWDKLKNSPKKSKVKICNI